MQVQSCSNRGLVKKSDCAYWMDGHCRFEEKVCWNNHDPKKKGVKSSKDLDSASQVFQEGGEERRPPEEEKAARGMDGENWTESMSRKDKRRMMDTAREKEKQLKEQQLKEQESQQRADGSMTPTFPRDGETTPTPQQVLLEALQTLLQRAGGKQ